MIPALLTSLRPKQWTKNLLVFAGYLFTMEMGHSTGALLAVLGAFGLFCAVSGAGYILNDVLDIDRDRKHPRKCKRPIASGSVPVGVAAVFASALLAASVWASFRLDYNFGLLAAGYFVLTAVYSIYLKHVVIVDLLAVAGGFVIRAVAGAVVIHVKISPWLLVCTTLLALFLGVAKRRDELLTLANGGSDHRRTLSEYSAVLLDQMLTITASATLMSYFLYTFTGETGTMHPYMMITVPFVVYGLFRYLFLVQSKNAGDSPEMVLLEDKPLLVDVILYIAAAVVALKL